MKLNVQQLIQQHDIILFDAICVVCNRWANFLIRNDQQLKFKLASAQSERCRNFTALWHVNHALHQHDRDY